MAHELNRDRRKQIAAAGEAFAERWFTQRGHVLVERNWRSGRFSEIDLVFRRRDGVYVFVEVKTRRLWQEARGFANYGFDAIDWRKQRKLLIAARSYIGRNGLGDVGYQCDAALVTYESFDIINDDVVLREPKVLHVANAIY